MNHLTIIIQIYIIFASNLFDWMGMMAFLQGEIKAKYIDDFTKPISNHFCIIGWKENVICNFSLNKRMLKLFYQSEIIE